MRRNVGAARAADIEGCDLLCGRDATSQAWSGAHYCCAGGQIEEDALRWNGAKRGVVW